MYKEGDLVRVTRPNAFGTTLRRHLVNKPTLRVVKVDERYNELYVQPLVPLGTRGTNPFYALPNQVEKV